MSMTADNLVYRRAGGCSKTLLTRWEGTILHWRMQRLWGCHFLSAVRTHWGIPMMQTVQAVAAMSLLTFVSMER